jgi:hypothetical protein
MIGSVTEVRRGLVRLAMLDYLLNAIGKQGRIRERKTHLGQAAEE